MIFFFYGKLTKKSNTLAKKHTQTHTVDNYKNITVHCFYAAILL